MKLKICWIGKTKEVATQAFTAEYLKRLERYVPVEAHELKSEDALRSLIARERTRPVVVTLDARGRQMTSEELAEFVRRQQDGGTQTLLFAVGPADGWTAGTSAPDQMLSLGKMTLAHEIARIVLLEQLYRAFTILAGHPYHTGH